jgi:hypothetical protein
MMKRYIVVAALLFGSVFGANAEDGFQANLVEVKIYKGDDGKTISCNSDRILVQEIYEVSNTTLNDLIMAHWTTAAPSQGGLSIHRVKYKFRDSNHVSLDYCQQKGMKADVQTRFMNHAGQSSNIVSFSIDTHSLKQHEANKYIPQIPIQ